MQETTYKPHNQFNFLETSVYHLRLGIRKSNLLEFPDKFTLFPAKNLQLKMAMVHITSCVGVSFHVMRCLHSWIIKIKIMLISFYVVWDVCLQVFELLNWLTISILVHKFPPRENFRIIRILNRPWIVTMMKKRWRQEVKIQLKWP